MQTKKGYGSVLRRDGKQLQLLVHEQHLEEPSRMTLGTILVSDGTQLATDQSAVQFCLEFGARVVTHVIDGLDLYRDQIEAFRHLQGFYAEGGGDLPKLHKWVTASDAIALLDERADDVLHDFEAIFLMQYLNKVHRRDVVDVYRNRRAFVLADGPVSNELGGRLPPQYAPTIFDQGMELLATEEDKSEDDGLFTAEDAARLSYSQETARWEAATAMLETYERVAAQMGAAVQKEAAAKIHRLRQRLDSGEKTQALYDAIVDLKEK